MLDSKRVRAALASLVLALSAPPAFAEPSTDIPVLAEAPALEQTSVQRLADLHVAVAEKRRRIATLQRTLRNTPAEGRAPLEAELAELGSAVERLEHTFGQIATGGVELKGVGDDLSPELNWQAELMEVSRPLLAALKEITEKPRHIGRLRAEIQHHERSLKAIQKAEAGIGQLRGQGATPEVAKRLEAMAEEWAQQRRDTENAIEVARFQLETLQQGHANLWQEMNQALNGFVRGRGETLGLAALAVLALALAVRALTWLLLHLGRNRPFHAQLHRIRVVRFASWGLFGVLSLAAVLMIFNLRGDLLLLSLTLFILLMAIVGLRNTLPKYLEEIRLLLDMGPVRSGERLVYQGVPYRVKTIQMYTSLVNPELRGVLRIPLTDLRSLISRPAGEEEVWFPCSEGEFVMLPDNVFARVQRQTIETVQLQVMGGPVLAPTADFIALRPRNLSREGFVVPVTFGIDYRHQPIALTEVPERLRQALDQAFAIQPYATQLAELVVDFKEASAHSLDYILVAVMQGSAAPHYHDIGRLIQKTCVDLCNREGWVIPFQQLTLHAGDGLALQQV